MDYYYIMGVPITFLDKYNPDHFEILGNELDLNISKGRGYIDGKRMYSRIFIRRLHRPVTFMMDEDTQLPMAAESDNN